MKEKEDKEITNEKITDEEIADEDTGNNESEEKAKEKTNRKDVAKDGETPSEDGAGDQEGGEKEPKDSKNKDPKDAKIADLEDKLMRRMAEFDNFRKRSEKEKTQMFESGAKSIIEKILPVTDSFERALEPVGDESDDAFVDGILKIYKQLSKAMEDAGVRPIEAVGKEFDPQFHNAVMHEDNADYGENEVMEELQKGYMYNDTVVRHSMVKVAN